MPEQATRGSCLHLLFAVMSMVFRRVLLVLMTIIMFVKCVGMEIWQSCLLSIYWAVALLALFRGFRETHIAGKIKVE